MSPYKRITILQPGYLPWLGFFEQMAYVDLFVYLDNVQYTKRDWRNRNYIKSRNGEKVLLSVPVKKCPLDTKINKVEISDHINWQRQHLGTIHQCYNKSPYFDDFFSKIEDVLNRDHTLLQDLCLDVVQVICDYIEIKTPIAFSSEMPNLSDAKNQKLVDICKHGKADLLFDGKAAETFIDKAMFKKNNIDLIFQDYQHPTQTVRQTHLLVHFGSIFKKGKSLRFYAQAPLA